MDPDEEKAELLIRDLVYLTNDFRRFDSEAHHAENELSESEGDVIGNERHLATSYFQDEPISSFGTQLEGGDEDD